MKAFFLLTLLAAILAPLASGADSIPPLDFRRRVLPNGLEFISLEEHRTPTVAIHVWYRVGSKDDPARRSGFAHLFEHMMFKSTQRMPAEFLDRLTEDVGGENNAYTQDDVTVYHESVPSNHLQRLLWAEAERLTSLKVDVPNFTLERDVVKEEFRQTVLAQPYGEFGEFLIKRSFAEHPYKRPTIGSIEELDAANLEEVRDFHSTYYRPDNAVLIVAGDFDPAQLEGWVDDYFGAIVKPTGDIPRVSVKEPPRMAARTIREYDPKVPLPALAVTYLAPSVRSEEAPALEILQRILSGGESSRLYRSLVYEKQLAQGADFSADLRSDLGLLEAELVLASGVPIARAEAALQSEIARLIEQGVTANELLTAHRQFLAEQLHERETCDGKAAALGYAAAILGDVNRANTELAALQAVTAEQVQAAAKTWLAEKNRLTIEYMPESMKPKARD